MFQIAFPPPIRRYSAPFPRLCLSPYLADLHVEASAIFQAGRDLIAAKADLREKNGHGQFIAMIDDDLPFTRQTC